MRAPQLAACAPPSSRSVVLAGLAVVASIVAACAPKDPSAPPAGFAIVDHDIRLGVVPALMRYDIEKFTVRPASKVKLTLTNNDSMQHNFILCRASAGAVDRVAKAAIALGEGASARDFVPDHQDVIVHTRALLPAEEQSIWFRAPQAPGAYPYVCTLPGHSFSMRGVMMVGEVVPPLLSELQYRLVEAPLRTLAELEASIEGKSAPPRAKLEGELIDLAAIGKRSQYGLWLHAKLHVTTAGRHRLFLRCDDGARVRVDGKEVVAHDGIHPAGPEREGSIELTAGSHELRVEYFQGGGGQELSIAIEGPNLPKTALTAKPVSPAPAAIPILVMHEAVVLRVHVEAASARSIAVGMPPGIHCVFDAETCRMQFAWSGAFLDVAPDRFGRGGQPCRILGERFEVGDIGFPLRREGVAEGAVRFRGYRTGKATSFLVDWSGQEVVWTVSPAPHGIGLRYDFELADIASDVRFVIDRSKLDVEASAGVWSADGLAVPAKEAAKFSVTIRKQEATK